MAASAHRQALGNPPHSQRHHGPQAHRQRDLRRIALAPVQAARPEPRPRPRAGRARCWSSRQTRCRDFSAPAVCPRGEYGGFDIEEKAMVLS
jgi:hypothetical protein